MEVYEHFGKLNTKENWELNTKKVLNFSMSTTKRMKGACYNHYRRFPTGGGMALQIFSLPKEWYRQTYERNVEGRGTLF